jgi:hypothetical protein
MNELGAFKDLVGTAGAIMAAGAAITLAFKGRQKWEPAVDDVPSGPARVAALLAAVAIALIWYQAGRVLFSGQLTTIAIASSIVCVAGLAIYIFLVTTRVYAVEFAITRRKTATKNIVGGLWLTAPARRKLSRKKNLTIQTLLKGAGNQPDLIWSREARACAKLVFIGAYLLLQVFGSIALAATALVVNSPK